MIVMLYYSLQAPFSRVKLTKNLFVVSVFFLLSRVDHLFCFEGFFSSSRFFSCFNFGIFNGETSNLHLNEVPLNVDFQQFGICF